MATKKKRSVRVGRGYVFRLRLSEQELNLLKRAAVKKGVPTAEFVRDWIKSL